MFGFVKPFGFDVSQTSTANSAAVGQWVASRPVPLDLRGHVGSTKPDDPASNAEPMTNNAAQAPSSIAMPPFTCMLLSSWQRRRTANASPIFDLRQVLAPNIHGIIPDCRL